MCLLETSKNLLKLGYLGQYIPTPFVSLLLCLVSFWVLYMITLWLFKWKPKETFFLEYSLEVMDMFFFPANYYKLMRPCFLPLPIRIHVCKTFCPVIGYTIIIVYYIDILYTILYTILYSILYIIYRKSYSCSTQHNFLVLLVYLLYKKRLTELALTCICFCWLTVAYLTSPAGFAKVTSVHKLLGLKRLKLNHG